VSAVLFPHEADAPLVVDPDAVLPRAAASEQLEAVPGRDSQVREQRRGIQLHELAERHALQLWWKSTASLAPEEPLGVAIAEAPDHGASIT
jgi:hypothetical protein